MRFELEDTFINTLNKMNLRWIRDRITQMWPQWVSAAREFAFEAGSLRRQHHVKKVVQYQRTSSPHSSYFLWSRLGEFMQASSNVL